jgi:hypothetical protein
VCNGFSGKYSYEDGTIIITDARQEAMYCYFEIPMFENTFSAFFFVPEMPVEFTNAEKSGMVWKFGFDRLTWTKTSGPLDSPPKKQVTALAHQE